VSVIPEIANRVDARVGDLIENAASRHHIRRLGRLGRDRALRGSANVWAEDPPPRSGNSLEVHIDGLAALPSIAAAVRGARSFVHVAGWTVDPGFAVERDPSVVTVLDLLAEAAQRVDVRVLVWAGAPLPIMQPSRARARELMDRLVRNTRIQGALDPRNRPMHCRHEKLVIVDGTVAFVGGIDLTALAGDRLDGSPPPTTEAARSGGMTRQHNSQVPRLRMSAPISRCAGRPRPESTSPVWTRPRTPATAGSR
jgi:phosphatidylserine/phosphatidylglycerophosphate/cardiolipin synthase-like enzyme